MAEELVVEEQQTPQNQDALSTTLQNLVFDEQQVVVQPEKKEDKPELKEEPKPFDSITYLKEKWGFENEEVADTEIKSLREYKEKNAVQEEQKWENDESKHIHELLRTGKKKDVLEYLNMQEKLGTLTDSEVSESNAADIVKLSIKNKYKEFTDSDVDRKFNKQFGIPKEPVQGSTEEEEDFEARKEEWKNQVIDIKADLLLEAKALKPDLLKLKTELILPEIEKKAEQRKELSPEELADFKKTQETFIQTANAATKEFAGFTANVKNKDVDYNVGYTPSEEQRKVVSERMQFFAESGFDANPILADRWVNPDKTLNVKQMTEDLSRIFMGSESDAKIANEASNKRMDLYLKDKKNIDLKETNEEQISELGEKGANTVEDKLRDKMFSMA